MDLVSPFYCNACMFSATELLARAGSCLKLPGILSDFTHMLEGTLQLLLSAALGVGKSDWIIVWEAVHLPQNDVGLKGL